jgi:hypothetical protein
MKMEAVESTMPFARFVYAMIFGNTIVHSNRETPITKGAPDPNAPLYTCVKGNLAGFDATTGFFTAPKTAFYDITVFTNYVYDGEYPIYGVSSTKLFTFITDNPSPAAIPLGSSNSYCSFLEQSIASSNIHGKLPLVKGEKVALSLYQENDQEQPVYVFVELTISQDKPFTPYGGYIQSKGMAGIRCIPSVPRREYREQSGYTYSTEMYHRPEEEYAREEYYYPERSKSMSLGTTTQSFGVPITHTSENIGKEFEKLTESMKFEPPKEGYYPDRATLKFESVSTTEEGPAPKPEEKAPITQPWYKRFVNYLFEEEEEKSSKSESETKKRRIQPTLVSTTKKGKEPKTEKRRIQPTLESITESKPEIMGNIELHISQKDVVEAINKNGLSAVEIILKDEDTVGFDADEVNYKAVRSLLPNKTMIATNIEEILDLRGNVKSIEVYYFDEKGHEKQIINEESSIAKVLKT